MKVLHLPSGEIHVDMEKILFIPTFRQQLHQAPKSTVIMRF